MVERILWSNTIFTNSSNITMKNKYGPISNPLTRFLPLLLEYFLWTPYTTKRWFTVVAAQIITSETYNYTKAVSAPFLILWFNKMRVGRTLVFLNMQLGLRTITLILVTSISLRVVQKVHAFAMFYKYKYAWPPTLKPLN